MSGGGKSSQTIGYKYLLDVHAILTHAQWDNISRLQFDKRTAWEGKVISGEFTVNAPDLFGGDKREGGVGGVVELIPGGPTQAPSSYLAGIVGTPLPAYRGVTGLLFKQFYFGMNPYLKIWSVRGQRIYITTGGEEQWYPAKAGIPRTFLTYVAPTPESTFSFTPFTSDYASTLGDDPGWETGNTDTGPHRVRIEGGWLVGEGRYDGGQGAYLHNSAGFGFAPSANYGVEVEVIVDQYPDGHPPFTDPWSAIVSWDPGFTDFTLGIDPSGYPFATHSFVHSQLTGSTPLALGTVYRLRYEFTWDPDGAGPGVGRGFAKLFVNNEVVDDTTGETITSAGEGTTSGIFNLSVLKPWDGTGKYFIGKMRNLWFFTTYPELSGDEFDMNPSHMIRECLVDPDWGMGYSSGDIDDASFTAAADTLYNESMGISLIWDRQMPIEDFIKEVIRHINAVLYVSRTTGKFVLKLIRDDYDVDTIPVLNASNVQRVEGFGYPAVGEQVNSVSANYWDHLTNTTASVTETDSALVIMQGSVINTTIQYPGFTTHLNGERAAKRDLRALSSALRSGKIIAQTDPAQDFNPGDPFLFDWPDFWPDPIVCRVLGMGLGTGKDNIVRLDAAEDVFGGIPVDEATNPGPVWEDPNAPPVPAEDRIVVEAPYLELIQRTSQADINSTLAETPAAGYLLASAIRPAPSLANMLGEVDDGSGWATFDSSVDFCPGATLNEGISKIETTFDITDGVDLDLVELGTHCQIGTELMKVTALSNTSITVGRGVGDTVPVTHSLGDRIFFWDRYGGVGATQYLDGESVDVRLRPRNGSVVLLAAAAALDSLTFDARAIRPYAPGRVKLNSTDWPTTLSGTFTVEWAHRDRISQADVLVDQSELSVGPEDTVRYGLRFENASTNALIVERTDLSSNAADVNLGTGAPASVLMKLWAISDNGASWHTHLHTFAYSGGTSSADISGGVYNPGDDGTGVIIDGGEVTPPSTGGGGAPAPIGGGAGMSTSYTARTIGATVTVPTLLTGIANATANSNACNAALAAFTPGSGGILRTPAGDYYLDPAVPVLMKNNTRFDSVTNSTILRSSNTNTVTAPFTHRDLIRVDNVHDVEIFLYNLIGYLDYWTANGGKTAFGVSEWAHGVYCTNGAYNVTIVNCTIQKCVGDAVSLGYTTHHIEVVNVWGKNCRRQGCSNGGDNWKIKNCKFEYISGTAPQSGIDIESDNGNAAVTGEITGCILRYCKGPGLQLYERCNGILVDGNTIEYNEAGTGAVYSKDSVNITFTNNIVRNNRSWGVQLYGICTGWNMSGNTFLNNRTSTYHQPPPNTTTVAKTGTSDPIVARHLKIASGTTSLTVGSNNYGPNPY